MIPAFEYSRMSANLLAGRNPLTAEDVDILVSEGVTHVLDLRQSVEWMPPSHGSEAIEEMSSRCVVRKQIAIRDAEPPSFADLDAAVAFMDHTLEQAGCKLYVHCRAGLERTACVLVAHHARANSMTADEALEELRLVRPGLRLLYSQHTAVSNWLHR